MKYNTISPSNEILCNYFMGIPLNCSFFDLVSVLGMHDSVTKLFNSLGLIFGHHWTSRGDIQSLSVVLPLDLNKEEIGELRHRATMESETSESGHTKFPGSHDHDYPFISNLEIL